MLRFEFVLLSLEDVHEFQSDLFFLFPTHLLRSRPARQEQQAYLQVERRPILGL